MTVYADDPVLQTIAERLGSGNLTFSAGGQAGARGGPTGTSFFPGDFIGTVPGGGYGAGTQAFQGAGGMLAENQALRNASMFGQRQAAMVQPLLQTLMCLISGGHGGFDFPSREDLLGPRLSDIEAQRAEGERRIGETATSQGRNISATPFQSALTDLRGSAQTERQRATGDVDTLLAQLGLQRQQLMTQLLMSILGPSLQGIFGR